MRAGIDGQAQSPRIGNDARLDPSTPRRPAGGRTSPVHDHASRAAAQPSRPRTRRTTPPWGSSVHVNPGRPGPRRDSPVARIAPAVAGLLVAHNLCNARCGRRPASTSTAAPTRTTSGAPSRARSFRRPARLSAHEPPIAGPRHRAAPNTPARRYTSGRTRPPRAAAPRTGWSSTRRSRLNQTRTFPWSTRCSGRAVKATAAPLVQSTVARPIVRVIAACDLQAMTQITPSTSAQRSIPACAAFLLASCLADRRRRGAMVTPDLSARRQSLPPMRQRDRISRWCPTPPCVLGPRSASAHVRRLPRDRRAHERRRPSADSPRRLPPTLASGRGGRSDLPAAPGHARCPFAPTRGWKTATCGSMVKT